VVEDSQPRTPGLQVSIDTRASERPGLGQNEFFRNE
jgi:hypothetical protein